MNKETIVKSLLILCLIVIFTTPVEATLNDAEIYITFDDDDQSGGHPTDISGNAHDMNRTNAGTGFTGHIGEAYHYDGTDDYVDTDFLFSTGEYTVNFWVKGANSNITLHDAIWCVATPTRVCFNLANSDITFKWGNLNSPDASSQWVNQNIMNSSWNMVTLVHNSSHNTFYYNSVQGDQHTSDNTAWTTTAKGVGIGRDRTIPARAYNGLLDEFSIYSRQLTQSEINDAYALTSNPYVATPSTKAEALEQTSELSQTTGTSITINSPSYVQVLSETVTIDYSGFIHAGSSVPLINPSSSNTATCRITKDSVEFGDTEQSRSLNAGENSNLLITSEQVNVTAGNHTFALECKRIGGGSYDISASDIIIHQLTTNDGTLLEHNYTNITTQAITSGVMQSVGLTTTENATATGLIRSLVLEWVANYDYTANGNITVTTELGGTNCTPVKRYGSNGDLGSVAGSCLLTNVTNSTLYTTNIYADGTGNISNAKFHIKEIVTHINEVNSTTLAGTLVNSTNQTLKEQTITVNAGHSGSSGILTNAVISVMSTSGSQTPSFFIGNGTFNTSAVSRTVGEGEAGVLGLQQDFSTTSGTKTITLYGSCSSCSLLGVDFVQYLTNALPVVDSDGIQVTLTNFYDSSTINEFNLYTSENVTYETTTGTINIFTNDTTINISLPYDNTTTIKFFPNITVDHNTSDNLAIVARAWTGVFASYNGSLINNFTLNYTHSTDTKINDSVTTTTGVVYVPLINSTYNLTIYDAVSTLGTSLAVQNDTVTNLTGYLENYTITMLTANTFNFSIIDELTEDLITENMTIELISTASVGTYSTTNGTLLLELLTPSNYTIRYKSTTGSNYTERDYYQVLSDQTRFNINLYSLASSEATDMIVTIKDTGGDPVESATVKLLRYYSSCPNCYEVVEMAKTSASGEANFIVDLFDGHYKFSVDYAGTNRFLSTSSENFALKDGLTYVNRIITINLGSAYFESFRELTNVGRTLVYNENTTALTFTWSDPSDLVTRGCLYASYLDGVNYLDMTPQCQSASTGSVFLVLNNTNLTYKYYAEVETSTTYSDYTLFSGFIDKISNSLFSDVKFGGFIGGLFVVFMALVFSFSAIAVMISTGLTIILLSFIGAFTFSTAFIVGFVALTIGITVYGMRS